MKRYKRSYPARNMMKNAKVGKSATEVRHGTAMLIGRQNVHAWEVGNGQSTLLSTGVRLRPWTWVNGMRVCIRFQNESQVALEYHWCLMQQREPSDGAPNTGPGAFNDRFFRDNRPGEIDVMRDFNDPDPATTWSSQLSCGRINSSNFRVMCHKKTLVAPGVLTNAYGDFKGLGHFYHYEKYIKMHKKLLFNAITDVTGRYPVYFVDWVTQPVDSNYLTASPSVARRFVQLVTYYDAF